MKRISAAAVDLSPLSRRRFIAALGAGAAGLVLRPPCLLGAEKGRSDLSFIVVSDTHIGRNDSALNLWRWAAAKINAAPGAFVLHLGDVGHWQADSDYPPYLETRKLIQKPVWEVPGNHDTQELFQQHVRREVDTFFDHDWLRVVLMNNSHPDSHNGFFAPEQLAWLSKTCDEAAERGLFILICAHVPVHANTRPDRGWYVQPADGQTAFYAIVKKHEARVLALFHGHLHNGLRGWTDHSPLHEISFPALCYNQNRKLPQTMPTGYNAPEFLPGLTLVRIHDGVMELKIIPKGREPKAEKSLPLRRTEPG